MSSLQAMMIRRAHSRPQTEMELALQRASTMDTRKLSQAQMAKSKAAASTLLAKIEAKLNMQVEVTPCLQE